MDVVDNPEKNRFEMALPGGTAIATYHRAGDVLIVPHTEVPSALEGHGYGSILVKGDVVSTGDLVIDGKVEGTIELGDHSLTIGETATIVADLVARDVIINGKVTGNVMGTAKVELKRNGALDGDITAPKFMMEDGAVLSGKVDTGDRK